MKFDVNKVYTAVNASELKIGDKVYVADRLADLKRIVEMDQVEYVIKIGAIQKENEVNRFIVKDDYSDDMIDYALAYLVERASEKRKKTVYISGQITGLDEGEYKALFNKAEDVLRQFGYEPVNPATLDETENTKNWSWHDYMKRDIKLICDCDYIYLLPNWRKSKGATFEYMIADALNIPCLNIQDVQEALG